jgi:uroporphyrinogen decarboxylase
MNSYERVLATVGHRQPDRTPLQWFGTDEVAEALRSYMKAETIEDLFVKLGIDFRGVNPDIVKAHPIPPHIEEKYGEGVEIEVTCYGAVLVKAARFPQAHRVYGPFFDTDDLDSFDWPKVSDIESVEAVRPGITRLNEQGYCTLVRADNPFKIAYFMRPYEEFIMDCVAREDYAFELMSRIAEIEFAMAANAVKAGARVAMIGGDFAHQNALMMSPKTFRKVLKPLLVDFASQMKDINPEVMIFLHSDGDLSQVLGDLIECGIDAVHPLQPESMDMFDVKRRYGDRLTLFGGVSVQSELPGSDPEVIRALVRQRIEQLGENGGFILAPTNTILDDVPLESIEAMYLEAQTVRASSGV